ncbi:hypothetical protein ACFY36_12920 [Actinoplanes sp. NPDC000266]
MVADWLVALAATAGSTIVGAATGDAWGTAKEGIAQLFRRSGERRRELAQRWAEETAVEILATPTERRPEAQQRLASVWQQRLADLLDEFPEMAEELQAWTDHVRTELPEAQNTWVHTYVSRDNSNQYNAPHGEINVTTEAGRPNPS